MPSRRASGFLTEDRKATGLVLKRPISENITHARFAKSMGLFMNLGRERADTEDLSRKLDIKTPSVAQKVVNLSGGNQQKVVLGKWLHAGSEVLIFDEPTVGIDIGAKSEIYRMMDDLARQGKAVIMISSDTPELVAVSDRVGVMRNGSLVDDPGRTSRLRRERPALCAGRGRGKGRDMKAAAALQAGKKPVRVTQSLVLIGLIIALCVVATIVNPRFLNPNNIINIFSQIAVLGIVASGIGMLLISGEIDISAGNQISLMGAILALIIQKVGGLAPDHPQAWLVPLAIPMAIVATFASGFIMGAINGFTVVKSRAASFIITLGFSSVYRGVALLVTGGASYMLFGKFELLGRGKILGIVPISILFSLGTILLAWAILKYTQVRPLPVRHRRQQEGGVRVGHQDDARDHDRLHHGGPPQRACHPDPAVPHRVRAGQYR